MRRITFNYIEGQFDLIDVEDINEIQEQVLNSILIEVDYTKNGYAPTSTVLTDEEIVLFDEIKE